MPDESIDPQSDTATDIVYDDEPMDAILWGGPAAEPTPASIFTPARKLLEELTSSEGSSDPSTILTRCAEFLQTAPPLTPALYRDFCEIVFVALEGANPTNELLQLWDEMVRVCVYREAKGELPELLSLSSDGLRVR